METHSHRAICAKTACNSDAIAEYQVVWHSDRFLPTIPVLKQCPFAGSAPALGEMSSLEDMSEAVIQHIARF